MRERTERRRSGRAPRLLRRLGAIVALALALTLANVFSPFIKNWFSRFLPSVDYSSAVERLTHEMVKAGELISVRHTDTGVMTGSIDALFLGTVSKVSAPYLYEIGLGIKLEDVKLTPGETELTVTVPHAQVLYDHFQVTGDVQNDDFWGLATQQRYQQMLDERHAACRQAYLDDPKCMERAWEAACEQMETLFRQWTGEELQLRFLREGE
ncbi:MAG: DUF4230 domain-containing protein [Clostridia bacterium]|nr:DUF4230 domain-containing protein [Clostridia bacterium]